MPMPNWDQALYDLYGPDLAPQELEELIGEFGEEFEEEGEEYWDGDEED